MGKNKTACAYCGKEYKQDLQEFCGKPCCEECKERLLLMDKLETNKSLSHMNSKFIKHGILKYGALFILVIAILVIFTADSNSVMRLGYIVGGISILTHIIATMFRRKYRATMNLLLEEYKEQIHSMHNHNNT